MERYRRRPVSIFKHCAVMKNIFCYTLLVLPSLLVHSAQAQFEWKASNDSDYFQPNSTGLKLQNGFERVFIQVSSTSLVRID